MRLKKLELSGFKSFPQKTEIIFNEGITGIVGPNGSGKSNIGDAVRWVLGEQSAKTLRGTSMSDVIFNGTQKRKPMTYCEVSLIFDNEDRSLPMDYAEIMVTRRVYRSGESEFFLNRAACRLKDIVDLFRDTGIGREGYSIIGQGRIDEILSRKSEDRRQVFEEAAGITKFKVRKEEADRRLERTLDNAARVDDILEELNRRLGPLEAQSRDAREYLALADELKGLELNLFLIRTERCRRRLDELDAELMNLRTVLADNEAELTRKTGEQTECQARIADLEGRISAARSALMEGTEEVHRRQTELAAVENGIANREANRDRLSREQTEAEARMAELAQLAESGEAGIAAKEADAAQAEADLAAAKEAAARAEEEEERRGDALEAHKEAILNAVNRLSAVQNDQTRLKTMRSQMAARLAEIEQGTADLGDERRRLEQAVRAAEERLEGEQALLREKTDAHQAQLLALGQADETLVRSRQEAERRSAELQAEQSRWKLLDEMTREMEGYSQSVRRAVQYSRDRGIAGVRGVLAQLITVPGRYETAIDMALGAAQQNIVTDTEETAKAIIDYLRQNRLGRATFLPQSAIRPKSLSAQERQVLTLPGCIGVASELIRCAPEYQAIVDNLLGRTVIADGLDNGIRIMRAGGHAFRLVTLDGDVMHSGGSMTGGSTQSKMVNLLGRERELKELTARLKEDRAAFEQLRNRLTGLQEQRNTLREAAAAAMEEEHQQEIAVARETERTGSARAELSALDERVRANAQAAAQLRASMEQIDSELSEINRSGDTVQTDRTAMEEKTGALQAALQQARTDVQHAQDEVMRLTVALSDAQHILDVMRHDARRLSEDREAILRQSAERARVLESMAAEDAADSARAAELSALLEGLQAEQARRTAAAEALESERSGEQTRLSSLISDLQGLHEDHDRDSDHIHRCELSRSRVDTDLNNLNDRIWNRYELTYAGAEPFRQAEGFSERDADRRVSQINSRIRELGSVNVNAVEEYAETKARWDELSSQQADLRKAEADLRELIDRLVKEMRVTFTENFSKLQVYFAETFTRLFGGGHAELQLVDPDDPLNCGIEVNAQPPGKKLQLLTLLSGGERALTAIAILFAMLKLKPTPFCILDEIEAALDDANIGYYADYLKEYSEGTQFIVITHRKGTMERCNALYGVAMEEQGVSRMVSVSLQNYDE